MAQVTAVLELPVTVAVNCWVAPAVTVVLFGDSAIARPVPGATLRVAVLLVTLPALLLTITVKSGRMAETVVGGVVYDEEFAPLITDPSLCHW